VAAVTAAHDKPDLLPPPPGEMTPEMVVWWNQTRSRHSDLAAAYARVRDALVDAEAARVRISNEPPTDHVSLKEAVRHAPGGITYEWARRLCARGLVIVEQSHKGASIYPSLSSFLAAVKKYRG
jgi:hypothetical protein